MPQELEIIRASEFIRMGADGHFDLAASKAALAVLVGACRTRGIDQAMLDLRQLEPRLKPRFTPADLAELVRTFTDSGFGPHQRLAILYRSDPHHRARLFAFLSSLHGWPVHAFGDFEHAVLWLSKSPEQQSRHAGVAGGKRVPIRFGRSCEKQHTNLFGLAPTLGKRIERSVRTHR